MGAIYSSVQKFTVTAGSEQQVVVAAPIRGAIRALLLRNVTDAESFTFELYSHPDAIADTAPAERRMYSVTGPLSSSLVDGKHSYENRGLELFYTNQFTEGRTTHMKPELYCAITLSGADAKDMELRMDIFMDVG